MTLKTSCCSWLSRRHQRYVCALLQAKQAAAMVAVSSFFFGVLTCSIGAAEAQQQARKHGPGSNSTQVPNGDKDGLPAASIAAGVLSLIVVGGLLLVAALIFIKQRFLDPRAKASTTAASIISAAGSPQLVQFSFKAIVATTRNFSDKIGAGILGSVYKGVFPDSETVVAVKKLEINTSDRDFRNCVSEIGFLSHDSLVQLHGFCADCGPDNKMLVYEFLSNGSLDKLLFEDSEDNRLDWKFRFDTALSVARGVAYLHQQQVPVIHGNLKTENILLDKNFQPKISDTGLGLLVDRRKIKTALSSGRVHGYFSPEWIADSPLTTKTDVYGFGMILLEIIGGRRILDLSQKSEQWNFVDWVSKQVKAGNYVGVADPRLSSIDLEQLRRGIDVAVWCIQDDAKSRPSMAKVVEELEKVLVIEATPARKKRSYGQLQEIEAS
ncbi:G-type lectin S-receptor-like serine/threonine-protein kinase SD2-5 isoform X1 [Selaginella moellendorffii]|nr:G-type lectin S-receptor-like serine/threonine-protein kinase SD2-5 isoform X1 [Selaginella moellendorffii]|eukprot:XP_024515338.1 G-type lectin S-receptor-like serine/threonine-protein kinase SD2-5 isoform X1 [Selaginella moellendorffii]